MSIFASHWLALICNNYRVEGSNDEFHLNFTFDSDVPCEFSVFTCVADSVEVNTLRQDKLRYGHLVRALASFNFLYLPN